MPAGFLPVLSVLEPAIPVPAGFTDDLILLKKLVAFVLKLLNALFANLDILVNGFFIAALIPLNLEAILAPIEPAVRGFLKKLVTVSFNLPKTLFGPVELLLAPAAPAAPAATPPTPIPSIAAISLFCLTTSSF